VSAHFVSPFVAINHIGPGAFTLEVQLSDGPSEYRERPPAALALNTCSASVCGYMAGLLPFARLGVGVDGKRVKGDLQYGGGAARVADGQLAMTIEDLVQGCWVELDPVSQPVLSPALRLQDFSQLGPTVCFGDQFWPLPDGKRTMSSSLYLTDSTLSSMIGERCYINWMKHDISFGEWLEDQLKMRGWSNTAFGELVGVNRTTVGNWCDNKTRPPRRRIRQLARVLEHDPNELLIRADYPPDDPDYVLPELRETRNLLEETRERYRLDRDTTALIDDIIELAKELERRRDGSQSS
jgi:transcriptional regulator with XRE-family HTH domain